MTDHTGRLIETIRDAIIGDDQVIEGPFGSRRVTYADYTASGRSLTFIEDFIREEVMPFYANTHSEASGTALQTSQFREDARQIIRESVGGSDEDAVIFCGSGATGAIHKLIGVLDLHLPGGLRDRHASSKEIPAGQRPVVFLGPYEHHSNELPWRESIADVVTIHENADGLIDLAHLEEELERYQDRPLKIGSFSAASNVTGIGSKTYEISILLHRYGALSFWDFAAAAPYVQIDMNPVVEVADAHLAYKDAIFISPHKFIGGPGTPGVLVAKRNLFQNAVPVIPGGGTVAYVTNTGHSYIRDPETREEGGTPAIIESIRAGLVFQLKEAVGQSAIHAAEKNFIDRAIASWDENPRIRILGNHDAWRLSIVSLVVRHGERYLHHAYVAALLNDLFGIQARSGCSCAGPYGHRLLDIDTELSKALEQEVLCGHQGIRPGWVRVNFNYFISETTFNFILEAMHIVANEGWKLLPRYRFNPDTGVWHHRAGRPGPAMRLRDLKYAQGKLEYRSRRATDPEWMLASYLEEARAILTEVSQNPGDQADFEDPTLGAEFEALRWFPLPGEALSLLRYGESSAAAKTAEPPVPEGLSDGA